MSVDIRTLGFFYKHIYNALCDSNGCFRINLGRINDFWPFPSTKGNDYLFF